MDIKRAVITAAGREQRSLPLQTLVDRDGSTKAAMQIILEEAIEAGIQEICVIVHEGDQPAYAAAAGPHASRVRFQIQSEPRGYGHAVYCAKPFCGNEPFLLLVGDHLYVPSASKRCSQQLVELARSERCSISSVNPTHESKLPFYGAIAGRLVPGQQDLYEVSNVEEKPTPTAAEQHLVVPGLRAGHYLCFFGMHIFTPLILDLLEERVKSSPDQSVPLSPALAMLSRRERYLAAVIHGHRVDIGRRFGLLTAQIALGLAGPDRAEVLSTMMELAGQRLQDHWTEGS